MLGLVDRVGLAFVMIVLTRPVTGGASRSPALPPSTPESAAAGDEVTMRDEEDPTAPFTSTQWQRIAVILVVAFFSIVFWMGFEQAGLGLSLSLPIRRPTV